MIQIKVKILIEEFKNYLKTLNLSEASVRKYAEQVPAYIKSITNLNMYDCIHINDLSAIINEVSQNKEFINADTKGNKMYSAGINHYYKFFSNRSTQSFNDAVAFSLKSSREARLKRLKNVSNQTIVRQSTTFVYTRNPDVVAERLYLANGICDDCKMKAPFNRKSDNTPYLEVHHIKPLSEGGKDILTNTVALCPNCHRKRHFG